MVVPDGDEPSGMSHNHGDRGADVGDWLLEHGWDVSVLTTVDMMALYDRHPPEGIEDGSPDTLFVSAQRSVGRA